MDFEGRGGSGCFVRCREDGVAQAAMDTNLVEVMMKRAMRWCYVLLAALILSSCQRPTEPAAAEVVLVEPAAGAEVSQLNAVQKAYLALPRKERVEFFADAEKREQLAEQAGYYPQPIRFSWEWAGHDGAEYTLHVSYHEDFSREHAVTTNECNASVDNLRIHTLYYWKVTAKDADGRVETSPTRTFVTADETPRLMRIDRIGNVRDLGGRKAMDGKRVRQDLVFRSARLNENARPIYEDEETVLDRDNGRLRKVKEHLEARVAACKEQLKEPVEIEYVPFSLGSSWSVFRPERRILDRADLIVIEGLADVPEKLFGAKREEAVMDGSGRFAFDKPAVNAVSIFMQEFTSPAEGVMQIGCGGDWFWDFRINGVGVYNKPGGNEINPVTASNYVFNVPVKKGKNFAVVVLRGGSPRSHQDRAGRPDQE